MYLTNLKMCTVHSFVVSGSAKRNHTELSTRQPGLLTGLLDLLR